MARFRIGEAPGAGFGIFATEEIPSQTVIFDEQDTKELRLPKHLAAAQDQNAIAALVDALDAGTRDAFRSLHGATDADKYFQNCVPIDTATRNADETYDLAAMPGSFAGAEMTSIFLKMARLNHSCRPNAVRVNGENGGPLTLFAMSQIKAGDEITISYLTGDSNFLCKSARAASQLRPFECRCALCLSDEATIARSDDRRRALASCVQRILGGGGVADAAAMFQLMGEEGLILALAPPAVMMVAAEMMGHNPRKYSPKDTIKVGTAVSLYGLKSRPELNGRAGIVKNFDKRTGRFGVQLDDAEEGARLCAVKPANMLVRRDVAEDLAALSL